MLKGKNCLSNPSELQHSLLVPQLSSQLPSPFQMTALPSETSVQKHGRLLEFQQYWHQSSAQEASLQEEDGQGLALFQTWHLALRQTVLAASSIPENSDQYPIRLEICSRNCTKHVTQSDIALQIVIRGQFEFKIIIMPKYHSSQASK